MDPTTLKHQQAEAALMLALVELRSGNDAHQAFSRTADALQRLAELGAMQDQTPSVRT